MTKYFELYSVVDMYVLALGLVGSITRILPVFVIGGAGAAEAGVGMVGLIPISDGD